MSVFHLKYRPQTLRDLDSESVAKKLAGILKSKDIPQTFLFSGPKGAGKTSAARIMARAINCTDLDGVDPCGKCVNCQEILKGGSLDVVEIDAASNRGIDEVRSLRDRAYLAPVRLKMKVFVIDEVHMMTKDAFNALLKLLEEPPEKTVFILCTTDEQKIPETVLSRLFKVQFEKGNESGMVKSLRRVVDGEGVTISEESLKKIANESDKSFRNLHKLFNEIVLEVGKEVTDEAVSQFFDKRDGELKEVEFNRLLAEGKYKQILEKLESMAEKGGDFRGLRERLIAFFQRQLLAECGVGDRVEVSLGLKKTERLLQLLILAGKTEVEAYLPQLPLQMVVVELMGGDGGSKEVARSSEPQSEKSVKTVEGETPRKSGKRVEVKIDKIKSEWGKVLVAVKPFNHSIEAFLRAVRPLKIEEDILVCEVFYPFHKDKLEEQKNRKIVEECLSSVFGEDMGFQCVLGTSKQAPIVVVNETPVEVVAPTESQPTNDEIYDVAKQIFG